MNFIEFIGFFITMVAFFLLMVKQAMDQRKRRASPEYTEEEEQEEENLEQLLKSMDIDLQEEAPKIKNKKKISQTPPPPLIEEQTTVQAPKEKLFKDYYALKDIHKNAYAQKVTKQPSRAKKMIRGKFSMREAMILREILGPPKSSHDH